MTKPDWNARYVTGNIPWDMDEPDPHLIEYIDQMGLQRGRVLDIGCGTGTCAWWLASLGFEVLGIDIAQHALERAQARKTREPKPDQRAQARKPREPTSTFVPPRFAIHDFVREPLDEPEFDFVFDRGVFHVFDNADDRAQFAHNVAQVLAPHGRWLSIAGSTEGPARDHGPPRRSARDLLSAIEPALELVELTSSAFVGNLPTPAKAWIMVTQPRSVPAQPSTRRNP